jgi:hypothetical protein
MKLHVGLLGLAVSAGAATAVAQTAVGTAFTYQGRLTDGGGPANGLYDLQVTLFDAATGGAQVPGTPVIALNDVTVTGGLFTVGLDFGGSAFAGSKRWLDVGVRPGASTGAYTPLTARQELTATPNSVFSQAAPWTGVSGKPAGFADNVDNDALGALSCANGQIAKSNGSTWVCGADTDSGGDITAVTAGAGLTGGAASGAATLNVNFGGSGLASTASRSDHDHFGAEWSGALGAGPGFWVTNNGAIGVYGVSSAGSGTTFGVRGDSSSVDGAGVFAWAKHAFGVTSGVYGRADSTNGRGVYGFSTSTSGSNAVGVSGETLSFSGTGTAGHATASVGTTYGVFGQSDSSAGVGVYGIAASTDLTSNPIGVYGRALQDRGVGVRGEATLNGYGVYGTHNSGGYAGYFNGRLHVNGTLSKSAGSFKIDHPLDPENKYLYHSFVESPDMKNIYDGVVATGPDGFATVEMPEWFDALNRDFRYQLTVIGQFAQAIVAGKLEGNRFTIRTDKPEVEVSWQITGIRKDPFAEKHRIPVEEDKPAKERGTYLHPREWDQPEDRGLDHQWRPALERPPSAPETR